MVGTGGEHWAGAGVAEEGGQPAAGDHPCAAAGARGSCGCARPWAGAIQGKWVPKRTQACSRTEIRIDNIWAMRTSVRIASIWAMRTSVRIAGALSKRPQTRRKRRRPWAAAYFVGTIPCAGPRPGRRGGGAGAGPRG